MVLQNTSFVVLVCWTTWDSDRQCCCSHQARVEAAGGQILFWNGVRVMGVLAVSRAIGDHCLRPFVIAQPEVGLPCISLLTCFCAGLSSADLLLLLGPCMYVRHAASPSMLNDKESRSSSANCHKPVARHLSSC